MAAQERSTLGTFTSPYPETKGKTISLRLPLSLDDAVREASKSSDSLAIWITNACREKLEKDKLKAEYPHKYPILD